MGESKFSKILVPVRGIRSDHPAIRLACQIARRDKAMLFVIYVIEVQRTLPLDAENTAQSELAEIALGQAEQVAHELGCRVETEMLQARGAGSALVDEATQHGIDLIIMGIPYRNPLGDFYLGTTASYVMKNAPCQVWLCREAAGKPKGTQEKK